MFSQLKAENDNNQEISLFDVKELYDAAYEADADQALMEQAIRLDQAYRAQLAVAKPFIYTKIAA